MKATNNMLGAKVSPMYLLLWHPSLLLSHIALFPSSDLWILDDANGRLGEGVALEGANGGSLAVPSGLQGGHHRRRTVRRDRRQQTARRLETIIKQK